MNRGPLVLAIHELSLRPGNTQEVVLDVSAPADLGTGVIGVPRCLEPLRTEAVVELSELYLYPEALRRAVEDGDEEGAEMFSTDGELLDLEPVLRDSVVTSLPFRPLCSVDCPGLCPTCGIPLRDAEPGHAHESIDPRLRVLEGWQGDGE